VLDGARDAARDGTRVDAPVTDSNVVDAVVPDSAVMDSAPRDTAPADTAPPPCPAGYSRSRSGSISCYRFVTTPPLDWQNAERDCESDGAHLIVVNDSAEDDFVPDYHWIGYSETVSEGTFLWVTGAGASSYEVWGGSDPDRSADAWCVVQRPDDWHDDNCFETKSYVCEYDGEPADSTTWR
jgi:hypothetical protein